MRDHAILVPPPGALDDRLQRSRGVAEIVFAPAVTERPGRGETRLARLHQEAPCRVLFPQVEPGEPLTAVLLTTTGGLTGGDGLRLLAEVEADATAVVTTQAAEKIYRATERDCRIDVILRIGEGAWLEWLPQETILFDRARLARRNRVELAPGGRLLACEILVFGRAACGERFAAGRLHDAWHVRRAGRLLWADALHLAGAVADKLAHPAGFDGAAACASVLYAADDAPSRLETARALLEEGRVRAGVTVAGGSLVARFLGRDAQRLREDVMRYCAGLRAAVAGLPPRMPQTWLI